MSLRFPQPQPRQAWLLLLSTLLLTAASLLHHSNVQAQAGPPQLTVYSPQTTFPITLAEIKGQPYAGLLDLLEPLGSVDAHADGKKYKLRFTPAGGKPVEAEFTEARGKAKLARQNYDLPADFYLQNGRGYISLSSVGPVLTHLLGQEVQLHASARRLFIGNVAMRFALELRQGNPSQLVISFPAAVNPTIATEPGRVRFSFRREGVMPAGNDTASYNDSLITGTVFSAHDGIAELDVMGTAPLTANYADNGRTIIVTAAPAPPPVASAPLSAPQAPATPETAAQPKTPSGPRFVVLLDPSHGGSDTGSAITPSLAEKDVVLALARRVQRELTTRGIPVGMLRTSDTALTLDQRAMQANAARPALYVALHAANTGRGVHVFTSLLPASDASRQGFLPWDTAQAAFLDLSGIAAGSVAAELEARKLPNLTLVAPLRPMNNIAAPAIAVEIAPPSDDVNQLASADYQEQVAQAIAAGIAAIRSKLPEVRR